MHLARSGAGAVTGGDGPTFREEDGPRAREWTGWAWVPLGRWLVLEAQE